MRAKGDIQMKFLSRLGLALVAVALVAAVLPGDALAKKPWEKFKFPELGDVTMPDYEKHELPNGMTVYLMPDDTWPLVEGRLLVRTGSVWEPGDLVGLASVTGNVLRTGGTNNISSDDLDAKLEGMGAYIESGIGETSGNINFSFLDKDSAEGLALVADVVRNPAFEDDKIDVAITGERAGVARRNDDLNGIVSREIQKAVWGEEHPYARHPEYATLDAISRDDIVSFYEYWYHPNNTLIAVWGNFDSKDMLAQIQDAFGDWPMVDTYIPDLPDMPDPGPRKVLVADKDDVTQARFAVGQPGMRADDPDYYAMSVANRILGGGFGDRLFNEVRSNLGLAYNVGSSAGVGWSRPGTFQAYCGTKSETTEKALGAVLGEIDKLREAPVTEEELDNAKEAILNSHVFNFTSKSQILNRMVQFDYWGYPEDFMETYTDRIRAVDGGAVQDVASRRINPDSFAIVAVGNTEDWDGDLTAFGPVEELDISIPEPEGEEFPDPTDETIEKGRGILARAAKAHGKVEKLAAQRRVDAVDMSMGGMSMSATVTTVVDYPDQMHVTIGGLPFGEMQQVVGKDAVWAKSPQGIQDVPGDQAAKMRADILKDPIYLLGTYDGFQVQSLPNQMVEDQDCEVVLVRLDDDRWIKVFFDAASSVLVKTETMGDHPMTQAPGLQETFYKDLRDVAGIKVPYHMTTLHDGEQLFDMKAAEVEINPSVDGSIFAKPSS